jgi:uncharacterized protein YfaQ (DUF2300 family)
MRTAASGASISTGALTRTHARTKLSAAKISSNVATQASKSISVGSSSAARELFTRFDTGHRCKTSSSAWLMGERQDAYPVCCFGRSPTATVFCRAIGQKITRSRRVTVYACRLVIGNRWAANNCAPGSALAPSPHLRLRNR